MILDDQKVFKKREILEVSESIDFLPDQLRQVVGEYRYLRLPKTLKDINYVVVNGMGGSHIGIDILRSAFDSLLKVPILVVPGYDVPDYVNNKTLFVIASYSGGTEEPLVAYREARRRGAKVVALVSDGESKLSQLMKKDKISGYVFSPKENPSKMPRLGLGYSIFGLASILGKLGLFKIEPESLKLIIDKMELWDRQLNPISPVKNNVAKKLAIKIHSKAPVLVAAEFLAGNMQALRNQINETAKNFSLYLNLPDMNHYAMEGLAFPKAIKKQLLFCFFESDLYHPRLKKRFELTKVVVQNNGIKTIDYKMTGESKIEQALELLQLGSWVSLYLGVLNKVNPKDIKWVDWFKKQLG